MQTEFELIMNDVSGVFTKTFETIRQHLTTKEASEIKDAVKWFNKVIEYNVPHGKKNRGLVVVSAFQQFSPKEKVNESSIQLSCIVGWCVEFLQAFFLVTDDIMDHSLTRRGQKCWYLKENVGTMAINDAILMHLALFEVLRHYASKHECYHEIVDLFLANTYKTGLGQCIDCLTTPDGCRPNFSLLTSERYATIVKYKTAYYSFDLPVRLGLYLAGIRDEQIHSEAQKILIRMGHMFQVQDDFLDFYGDPNVTGKIGTDIEDGKCSWIAVEAVKLMSAEENELFRKHYGYKDEDSANIIRSLYNKLNVDKVFYAFEDREYAEIRKEIEMFGINTKVETKPFYGLLDTIYKRKK